MYVSGMLTDLILRTELKRNYPQSLLVPYYLYKPLNQKSNRHHSLKA